jgi:hypothetical protein
MLLDYAAPCGSIVLHEKHGAGILRCNETGFDRTGRIICAEFPAPSGFQWFNALEQFIDVTPVCNS